MQIQLAQDDIIAAIPQAKLPDIAFNDDSSDTEQMRVELAQLLQIVAASEERTYWNRSEAAWNLVVHWPMLQIALSSVDNVSVELVYVFPPSLPRSHDTLNPHLTLSYSISGQRPKSSHHSFPIFPAACMKAEYQPRCPSPR